MKKIIILIFIIFILSFSVSAEEYTAPQVPDSGEQFMPAETESFAEGLWFIIKSAVSEIQPNIAETAQVCLSLIATIMLISLLKSFSAGTNRVTEIITVIAISAVLLKPTNILIGLGMDTVKELCEYGKLLLPVMTAALAAQGGATTSAALYTGTALFNSILSGAISKIIIPILYVYICLGIAECAINEDILKNIKNLMKWLMTWSLKIILYVFTAYISITGVVSGTADASAIKAAKLAISGFVPVVGSIISDASETILISAGIIKSAAGVYGLLATIAVWIGPFVQIGIQYVLLKVTTGVCSVFGVKKPVELLQIFTSAMGMLLAMTSSVCLFLMISTICFMKGLS